MQIRAFLQLDNFSRRIVLSSAENETLEHLALKLAALALFIKWNPVLELSSKSAVAMNQEFKPDLAAMDAAGELSLWVECGNVSTNKIEKLARRLSCRIVALKESVREAENLRRILDKNKVRNREKIEILAFPDAQFKLWMQALEESTEIFGEMSERSFNLVCNATTFNFEFARR